MASVHKDRKGYRLIWREDGKRRSKAYPSKSEAMAAKRFVEAHLAAAKPPRIGERLTLKQLIDRWLDARPQTYRDHDAAAMRLLQDRHKEWQRPTDIDRDGLLALPIAGQSPACLIAASTQPLLHLSQDTVHHHSSSTGTRAPTHPRGPSSQGFSRTY